MYQDGLTSLFTEVVACSRAVRCIFPWLMWLELGEDAKITYFKGLWNKE